ncbi:hypothetical protein [Pseudomonas coleopterorum]|uniref:hypothetical protein n=1 Tax=Pseudomonas coleopterorum TaxID=1605838 RepID=UPI0008988B31|nr:hypothetical protein [Pseudomonas coleopterorum]SEE39592.1 hypothetical protein SAMN05216510_2455 [Pseudomonas coleopterorum]
MSRVTVVIEGATAPIRLGMLLAGGRITSAHMGDYSDYPELLDAAKSLHRALFYYNQMPEGERLAIERSTRDLIAKLEAQ